MRRVTVVVGGVEAGGGESAVEAEVVLVLLDAVGDLLERGEILDVIEGLDDRVALLGVLVDDLLVGDDAEPFGGVRQAVHVVAVLVGHLLALLVEQLVGFGVLQRLEVILVLGVLVEAADAEHGRGVVLGQLGRQRGFVAAGSGGLDVDLHAGFLGVHVGEFVPLVDDFRLVVQEVDMACVAVRA